MSLIDKTGMFLEGIRVATGGNSFTFPPRNYVIAGNEDIFQTPANRAEYAIVVGSTDPTTISTDIADSDLVFQWSRNEPGSTRFDWEGFTRRWNTSPGSSPDNIGVIANDPRLVASVPDPTVTSAPFAFYVGNPSRLVTFDVVVVDKSADFTDPGTLHSGKLEIAQNSGEMNFSSQDVALYVNQIVYGLRQNFFDRTKSKGQIGNLPLSSATSYHLFLNPLPAPGQTPRIRIGHGSYLNSVQVSTESALGTPAIGTVRWAKDTGRVAFAPDDIDANADSTIYYDGVFVDSFQLDKTVVGPLGVSFPNSQFTIPNFAGITDPQRYVIFAEAFGLVRSYFDVTVIDSSVSFPDDEPGDGEVYIDTQNGNVYFCSDDVSIFLIYSVGYLHTAHIVERGVTFQAYRCGLNGSGEPSLPDFVIKYAVSGQILQDGISASPFVMLPTTPIVDSTLQYFSIPGPSSTGTFFGELVAGSDPTKHGPAYLLDLDNHQLKFAFRKIVDFTLAKDGSVLKLADGAVSPLGFEVTKNGISITPGVDFNFNPDTGLLEFLEPIGEDDPDNILGINGTVTQTNKFTANQPHFDVGDTGKYLFFPSGTNAGIYEILSVDTARSVTIDGILADGSDSVDLRQDQETVADRFWVPFTPPFKKFTLAKADSPAGPFTRMDESDFSVLASAGQINLVNPTLPGESYQATYTFLSSPDNGVTVTPVPKVEKALFKVRQETAISTVGSNSLQFNSDGNNVNTSRAITLAINGRPQDATAFNFIAPSTIQLVDPVLAGQTVVVDYWVENSPGGNTSFNLLSPPIDIDPPIITLGSSSASFNGDQTSIVSQGSAFFCMRKDVLIVQKVTYDSSSDMTHVVFELPSSVAVDGSTKSPDGSAAILVSQPITGKFRIPETSSSEVFPKGTNHLTVHGDGDYRISTIITVDGDPYYVISVKYDKSTNKTKVTTSASAYRNYVKPDVTRTVRPVLDSDSKFTTKKPLDVDFPVTLIKMGPNREVLTKDVDFTVSEGGVITLSTDGVFGDSIHALYVARKAQPAGTKFELNYAHAIAPGLGLGAGLLTQQLVSNYTLYAPDTFFYRIESFATFLPEVQDLLQQSAQSGGASGPDTGSRTSLKSKDFGSPSLYFPEQHYSNVDTIIVRLLKYYNDLINAYEDVLADLDGRVVGGTDGRFLFDGKNDNPLRKLKSEVTNDIDDEIVLYYTYKLTDFFDFNLAPVGGLLGGVNRFSRFFPTLTIATAALNNQVTFKDFGKTMGSLQVDGSSVTNIRILFVMTNALSNAKFTSTSGGGTVLHVDINGDAKSLLPKIAVDQHVQVYGPDGTKDVLAKVTAVSGLQVTIDTATTLSFGSILQDTTDSSDDTLTFYVNGRDLNVDFDSGAVNNATFPSPLDSIQNAPKGEEIIESFIYFVNQNTKANRIPALDGVESTDDGIVSRPQLSYQSESEYLKQEQSTLSGLGTGRVASLSVISDLSSSLVVGDVIRFLDGPNAGIDKTVSSVISPLSVRVSAPFTALDSTDRNFSKVTSDGSVITDFIKGELGVLNDNDATPPIISLIGIVNGEMKAVDYIIRSFGPQVASGNGNASGTTLSDPGMDFSNVGKTCLIYVLTGANQGLYKVLHVMGTTITIDTAGTFVPFPVSTSVPYIIIKPYGFLGTKGPSFLTKFIRDTLAFYASTESWGSSLDPSGIVARQAAITNRLSIVTNALKKISSILSRDDKLYDLRYLWIDQRINRKTGILTQLLQSQDQRAENLQKLLDDQEKLFVTQILSSV